MVHSNLRRQAVLTSLVSGQVIDYSTSMAVYQAGRVYVGGGTDSGNFPVSSPIQAGKVGNGGSLCLIGNGGDSPTSDPDDGFLAEFSHTVSLLFSSYLGGPHGSNEVKQIDRLPGKLYVLSSTTSRRFPFVPRRTKLPPTSRYAWPPGTRYVITVLASRKTASSLS